MAFEKVKLFGKIEVDIAASSVGTFALLTDVPGYAMAQRFTFSVPITTRRPVVSRVPNNTVGHLLKVSYTPGSGQAVIYGARIWARELPGGQWQWYPLPVVETPVEFTAMDLPIPRTPEEFSPARLPIQSTPEEWASAVLPIPPTPEEYSAAPLPIPQTPEAWSSISLPVKPTPVVPDWADMEIDQ